jgi:pentatricopeptide repeat protein
MDDAWRVFNEMPSRDVVTWNALLGGCAMHGHVREALKYFELMCEEVLQPDDIPFVCLLSACSHAGLVDEGRHLYASMLRDYMIPANITPAWFTFLAVLAIYRRQRILSRQCPVYPLWLHGWLCLVLAEFMVTWRWQNALPNEFLKWSCHAVGYVLLSNIYAAAGNRHLCENVER